MQINAWDPKKWIKFSENLENSERPVLHIRNAYELKGFKSNAGANILNNPNFIAAIKDLFSGQLQNEEFSIRHYEVSFYST